MKVMDPWKIQEPVVGENAISQVILCFEDNFEPRVSDSLPDSKEYLETLEKKLFKLKSDPNVLKQLAEKREACFSQLLNGITEFDLEQSELEEPVNSSTILRTIAPERQALTQGELVELVKYDQLEEEPASSEEK